VRFSIISNETPKRFCAVSRNKEFSSMIRWSNRFVLVGIALMLGACGSSPTVRYFGLETIGVAHQRDAEDAPILLIGPLRVPDYLKRPQMVRRGQGSEMIVDDFNRWAEPLNDAIHRAVASNVDGLLDGLVVVAFPSGPSLKIDYRLIGYIDRFDADSSGNIVLEMQWGIGDDSGAVLAAARRSRYESRAGQPGDPASIAQAMSDAIAALSRDIAKTIEPLLR
jgi:uncharacterized lipoprotein YmbA